MKRSFYTTANGPTWSVSRDQQLQSCERKYFFQYVAEAKINSPDPWLRGIALLKKLKNIPMWQGECVHLVIAEYLNQVRQRHSPAALESLVQSLRQRMQREWQFSEKRRFREEPAAVGKTGVALFEHEYDEMPPETSVEALIEKAAKMTETFYAWAEGESGLAEKVRTADRIWIEPPAWGVEAPGFMTNNVQVITKVDLALHHRGVSFTVYDWKTGKPPRETTEPSQNELQVSVYMLWANLGLKLPLDGVTSRLVYLGGDQGKELCFDLDEERAVETYRIIEDSVHLAQQWESYFAKRRLKLGDLDYTRCAHSPHRVPILRDVTGIRTVIDLLAAAHHRAGTTLPLYGDRPTFFLLLKFMNSSSQASPPSILRVFQSTDQTRAFYNKISHVYDLLSERSEAPVRKAGFALLGPKAGETVLEIGFGTGHTLVSFAKAVGPRAKVLGLDLSGQMVNLAKQNLAKAGLLKQARIRCGDTTQLPYADGSVDAIFLSFTLWLFDTPGIPEVLWNAVACCGRADALLWSVNQYGYNELPEKKCNPLLDFVGRFWGPIACIRRARLRPTAKPEWEFRSPECPRWCLLQLLQLRPACMSRRAVISGGAVAGEDWS